LADFLQAGAGIGLKNLEDFPVNLIHAEGLSAALICSANLSGLR
jgi:hypothetical protein